jgi:hypothetical protein
MIPSSSGSEGWLLYESTFITGQECHIVVVCCNFLNLNKKSYLEVIDKRTFEESLEHTLNDQSVI